MSLKSIPVLFLATLLLIPVGYVCAQAKTQIEGESLVNSNPPARVSAGAISVQNMKMFGKSWTGDEQLFWMATKPNDRLTLPFSVAVEGNYQVAAVLTKAPDYGQIRIELNGKSAATFDGFATQVSRISITVATAQLKAGQNSLTIVVTGKNRKSTGYFAGIDHFVLVPASATLRPGIANRLRAGMEVVGQQNESPPLMQQPLRHPLSQQDELKRLENLVQKIQTPKIIPPSKSTTKVWTGQGTMGKEFFVCIDSFFLSDEREDLNWWIQWSTRQQGATKAIYQVSLFPFDDSSSNWFDPPGLVASGVINQAVRTDGIEQHFQIDLAELIPSRSKLQSLPIQQPGLLKRSRLQFQETRDQKPGLQQPGVRRTDVQQPRISTPIGQPGIRGVERQETNPRRPITVSPNQPSFTQPSLATLKPTVNQLEFRRVLPQSPRQVPLITFYIRVVTLRDDNSIVGAPARAAVLSYGKHKQAAVDYLEDPNANQPPSQVFHRPECRIVEYRAYRVYQPDWTHHFIITQDFDFFGQKLYTKGQHVYWPPSGDDDGWWEKVSGAFGSLVDFASDAVNAISNAYASIKSNVFEFVAQNIPFCNDDCKSGLTFALDYGLASVGLPPSLPNFDDLKSLGKDYLIQCAVDQTNLPIEEAVKVIDKYMEEVDNAAAGGGWYKLDTSYQYSDAMLLIEVWNATDKPTDPVYVRLEQFHKLFVLKDVGLGPKETLIPLPSINPGQRIQVPVMMKPNTIQHTPGADFIQSVWNEMADQGTTLTLYGSQTPESIVVHNKDISK